MGDVLHLPLDRFAPGPQAQLERQAAHRRRARPHAAASARERSGFGLDTLRLQTWAGPQEGTETVGLRPLAPADLLQLDEWLQRPHVRRWWDADGEAWSQIVDAMETTSVAPFVITVDGVASGYLECSEASHDPVWRRFGVPDETISLDLFLADATEAARAIGTTAVRIAAQNLFADPRIHRVQATPHPRDTALLDLLASAGFQSFGAMITPYGPLHYWSLERG